MRVWVDTDLALGAPRGDVDDGFALAALLSAPSVELLGISTVFGNSTSARAARCARALLDAAGRSTELVEGAARAGAITAAAEAIAALPDGTTLLALGPLTNVAAALARDPGLAARVEVHLVGGNLSSRGRWPPLWPFEFNLAKDAASARAVFDSDAPLSIHPLDVCRRLAIGARALLRLDAAGPLGRHLARGSLRWLAYAPLRYRALSFPLWDLCPALDRIGLLAGRFEMRRLRFEGRGRLVPDEGGRPARCLVALDGDRSLRAFLALLSPSDNERAGA